ncbi:PD-(D/E)XK nuclease-like domain-containing protein [Aliarcobacter butzleri]
MTFNKLIPPNQLSNAEYHKIKGISASGLKTAKKDLKLYFKKHLLKRLPSSALDIGTCVHEALLEPEKFSWLNYNFTPKDKEKAEIMINNGKVMFDYILKDTLNEHSLFVQDDGFIRKVRVDAYNPKTGVIFDVKTTRYNSVSMFIKDAYELNYHLQCSFYLDTLKMAGYKADYFVFLVIPSESPCEPFAVIVDNFIIEDGREEYNEILLNLQEYNKTNEDVFLHEMTMPVWRMKQKGLIE